MNWGEIHWWQKRTYQSRAQIMYPNSRYIDPVNNDSTAGRINLWTAQRERLTWIKLTYKSKNAHGQRRFSTSYPKEVKQLINVQIQVKNEPVRPRRPTRSPAFKVNDTSCSTAGRSGAYLMIRFSATRRESFSPFDGQYAGTRWDSITAGGSCGKSRLEIGRKWILWMQRWH